METEETSDYYEAEPRRLIRGLRATAVSFFHDRVIVGSSTWGGDNTFSFFNWLCRKGLPHNTSRITGWHRS
jgi:hypothetical protein